MRVTSICDKDTDFAGHWIVSNHLLWFVQDAIIGFCFVFYIILSTSLPCIGSSEFSIRWWKFPSDFPATNFHLFWKTIQSDLCMLNSLIIFHSINDPAAFRVSDFQSEMIRKIKTSCTVFFLILTVFTYRSTTMDSWHLTQHWEHSHLKDSLYMAPETSSLPSGLILTTGITARYTTTNTPVVLSFSELHGTLTATSLGCPSALPGCLLPHGIKLPTFQPLEL